GLLDPGDLVGAQRGTVRLAGVHLGGRRVADDRAQHDQAGAVGLGLGGLDGGQQVLDVLPTVDGDDVPAVGLVPLGGVLGQGDPGVVLDGDLIGVVDHREVAQLLGPGQRGRLGGDAFLDVAVGGDHV